MHKIITKSAISTSKTPNSVSQPNVPTLNRYIQQIIKITSPVWFISISATFKNIFINFWSIFDTFFLLQLYPIRNLFLHIPEQILRATKVTKFCSYKHYSHPCPYSSISYNFRQLCWTYCSIWPFFYCSKFGFQWWWYTWKPNTNQTVI